MTKSKNAVGWIWVAAILVGITSCTKFTIQHRCCQNEYEITTTRFVAPDSFTLFIPQAFTPNGDGVNDIFMPRGRFFKVEELLIKKGTKTIYESHKHLEAFWDGDGYEDGRYRYTMRLRLSNNELIDLKGNVCIMTFGSVGDDLYDLEREQICECITPDMIHPREGVIYESPECPTSGS